MRGKVVVSVSLLLLALGCEDSPESPSLERDAVNPAPDAGLVWTMIELGTGDAHLIQVRDGLTVLLDTSTDYQMRTRVLPFLQGAGIVRLDLVVISHSHRDHVGGMLSLLQSGIACGRMVANRVVDDLCETDGPVYCSIPELDALDLELDRRGMLAEPARPGDRIDLGGGASFLVLSGSHGVDAPIEITDTNDTSLVMRLEYDGFRLLFTGDVGPAMGAQLSLDGRSLRAHVLKMPHHGLEPLPDDLFFRQVGAQYLLVPSGPGLWCDPRADRVRQLYLDLGIPVLVSSVVGAVRVRIERGQLSVSADRDSVAFCQ